MCAVGSRSRYAARIAVQPAAAASQAAIPFQRGSRRPRLGGSALELEAVSNSGLRDDQPRSHGVGLELAAKVGNVDAQVMLWIPGRSRPDGLEQLLMGERLARVSQKRAQ